MDIRKALSLKSFKRIADNHSLSGSQQQMQATDIQEEIRMSINLSYLEGTSKRLQHIFKYHKRRSTFYTESTQHKLLYKLKDQVATEDKNNINYEIDSSNCEAVYFGESK